MKILNNFERECERERISQILKLRDLVFFAQICRFLANPNQLKKKEKLKAKC